MSAVEKMLGCVICRIAYEGFRIDHQPRLTAGSQDVAGMEVSREQGGLRGLTRQTMEQMNAFANQSRVGGARHAFLCLRTPKGQHGLQGSKRVRRLGVT